LTAHGSGATVVVGAGTTGADGRAVAGAGEMTVGSGVLETVESPEPHPATDSAAAPITTAHFTVLHRTAIGAGGQPGARRVEQFVGTRLCRQ
jgi:hypothetical protein